MSTLTWPAALVPNALEWALTANTQQFRSELNGAVQTNALPGDRWSCNMTFANLIGTDARTLMAFLASLRGQAGRFYLKPFDHATPVGTAAGTGLVNGASQTGSTLVTDGWTPSQAGLLLPGDYFQVGSELKMITATIASDSGGNATLSFVPPLRTSPANDAAIITTNPTCIMALADGDQSRWQAQPWSASSRLYAITIACEEPLDIA